MEAPAIGEQWIELLSHAGSHVPEEIPPGWKTTRELVGEWAVSLSTVLRRLQMLQDRGLVERRTFKIQLDQVRPIMHYRVKDH